MSAANQTETSVPPAVQTQAAASTPVTKVRDIRLDFFRGIAMFIILIAHTPGNFLTLWIPARWGFSDATEIFVFCSGMASAIAFGRTFDNAGWALGTTRVAYRVWQVYWAHVGLFCATVALTVWLTSLPDSPRNYWGQLNLWPLFVDSERWSNADNWLAFMTLRYVPNYFDILPMYMVVLVMMPLVMALSRVNLWAVAAFVLIVWIMAQEALLSAFGLAHLHLELPAEPWSDRHWFFNPFGWQLIFFAGFAFMRGWLPSPPVTPLLIALAAAIVIANVPLSSIGVREFGFDWAREWRIANGGWFNKSDFGILRFLQFLALAYLMWVLAGDKGNRLRPGTSALSAAWGHVLKVILKVGQQSLAVFVMSMFTARFMGYLLDVLGRDVPMALAINLFGALVLVATAYGVAWFKSHPWRVAR